MKLTSAARRRLPGSAFAISGDQYLIEDEAHARDALARASGKPVEPEVKAKVKRRFPDIKQKP